MTSEQPIWWDEADYLADAKNRAGSPGEWEVTAKHNSLYPYLTAFFFMLKFSEPATKFFLQVIPSILSVLLVFIIANKMYNKKTALISSFILSVFWVHLFNTMRFHIGIPALFTGLLAIYVFWTGYERKEKIFGKIPYKWAIPLTVFFVVLTYSIRRGYFLFGVFFLIYMLSTKKIKTLYKDKYNWLALFLAIFLLLLTETFIFTSEISTVSEGYFHGENSINLIPLQVFPSFFSNTPFQLTNFFLFLFWIGLAIVSFNLAFSLGHIKKSNNNSLNADLFNILAIIITLSLFIFVLRGKTFGEPRWYFPLAFSSFIFISKASLFLLKKAKPYSKKIPIYLLIIVIAFSGFYQITSANSIIKGKIPTYQGIREAGLFLKEISSPEDLIITVSRPQIAYYAERKVVHPRWWLDWTDYDSVPLELFLEKVAQTPEAKYLLVSFSEPNHPLWMRNKFPHLDQKWEIPFTESSIDFKTQQQDIKPEVSYGPITFKLLEVKEDVFIYEISR